MKILTISLLLSILILNENFGQCCPYMTGIEISPINPTTNDTVTVITSITTPSIGMHMNSFINEQIVVEDQTINLHTCHFSGFAGQPQNFKDTFYLDNLLAGDYSIIHHAAQTFSPDSCIANQSNRDTLFFTVMGLTNILQTERKLNIFPNPISNFENLKIESSESIREIVLFDRFGKEIVRMIPESKNDLKINMNKISKGIYFILVKTNSKTYTKKIIKID